ncbi:hypothetical protein ABIF42_001614 [Bradyrhizobium diazoefficiens]
MPERGLPRKAGQDQQRHADGCIDADEDELAHQIAGEHVGRDQQQREQDAVGDEIARMREQLDVVFVVGLEQEAHGVQTFLRT